MEYGEEQNVARGQQLMQQGRHAEAADHFRLVLSADPEREDVLAALAWCLYHTDGKEPEALEVIGQAIRRDPDNARFHAQKTMILAALKKFAEAHATANHAIGLDPYDPLPFGAKAQTFAGEQKWAPAEEFARRALAVDSEDSLGANLLSQALLMQGKQEETDAQVAYRLSRDPEDELAHFNAGYAALRKGDHRTAERHFAEALRLEPEFEPAREGMLESFRARSPLYRAYLRYVFWMSRLSPRWRMGVIIGLYLVYRVVLTTTREVSPNLVIPVVALYLLFAVFTFVSRGVGTFIILFDRRARLALNAKEKWEGVLIGGGIVIGVPMLIAGAVLDDMRIIATGIGLAAPTLPIAVAFSSESVKGRWLYGSLGILAVACAAVAIPSVLVAGELVEGSGAALASFVGAVAVVGSTWLALFNVFRE